MIVTIELDEKEAFFFFGHICEPEPQQWQQEVFNFQDIREFQEAVFQDIFYLLNNSEEW